MVLGAGGTARPALAALAAAGLPADPDPLSKTERLTQDPRGLLAVLVRNHFDVLLGPGSDFIPVMLYEWRSITARQRGLSVVVLEKEPVFGGTTALSGGGIWNLAGSKMETRNTTIASNTIVSTPASCSTKTPTSTP